MAAHGYKKKTVSIVSTKQLLLENMLYHTHTHDVGA